MRNDVRNETGWGFSRRAGWRSRMCRALLPAMSDAVLAAMVWAAAAVLAVITIVLIFRKGIAALIPRIKKLG